MQVFLFKTIIMIIREFTKDDIDACAALHKSSCRESEKGIIFDEDLDRYDDDHFIENWTEWSGYKETSIFVAEDNNQIIGFVMFGKVKTRPPFDKGIVPKFGGEIYALYIHPDHFRQGVGKALFLKACEELTTQKITSMILWAMKKNKRACGFYDSFSGDRVGKKKVEMGKRSWVEETCFAWKDIRPLLNT